MPLRVSDAASNANEQIAHAAEALGRSELRRKVFEAIYHGKKQVKTVSDIMKKRRLTRKQVLTEGRKLFNNAIVEQVKQNGETGYKKIGFYHQKKHQILRLAGNKEKLDSFATKRTPRPMSSTITIKLGAGRANTQQVTIDDISSFSKVQKLKSSDYIPKSVSEDEFKRGIQVILGERGKFKDWGGERNDLFTTRVRLSGHRRATAFAFKGPGTTGKLVPGKMGENGDQIQRLFEADAQVFLIQYCREIAHSILDQMVLLATAKSLRAGKKIWYGVIDGQDSNRIYVAYASSFTKKSSRRKTRARVHPRSAKRGRRR